MHKTPLAAALVAAMIALLAMPDGASAQQVEDGTITVIQPKPMLRRHRLQLTPRIASTLNDAVLRQWSVGGSLTYNISERLYIGGIFEWFDFNEGLGGTTQVYEEVITATDAIPELAPLTMVAGLEVGFVPAYGKLVLFNKTIGYFDLYVVGGPVAIDSQRGIHVGGTAAVGVNLYFNRWLGLNTEFRDRLSIEELPGAGNSFTNTVTGSIGLTIMLPFNFEYRYDDEGGE